MAIKILPLKIKFPLLDEKITRKLAIQPCLNDSSIVSEVQTATFSVNRNILLPWPFIAEWVWMWSSSSSFRVEKVRNLFAQTVAIILMKTVDNITGSIIHYVCRLHGLRALVHPSTLIQLHVVPFSGAMW